ncbi:amidase domain-containing protein [Rhodococcus jostii]|uniref:amidase domain-containing protein n=1 Tax=Rhodococcus jostii TaxID=132919 RepID=UPI00362D4E6A
MCGLILDKYRAMGGPSGSLGYPTTNENVLPDQVGRSSVFEHGSIFWSPNFGAHPIWGRIGDKWGQKGWEGGFLHYPTSDELRNPDGRGLHQTFQGGSIYWSPETDAHSIGGLIGDKWGEKGWERGTLGYPTTDETGVTGGAFNHFQGGSVYWSSDTGAHSIWGKIRDRWANAGWERSKWGFPRTDEYDVAGGKRQDFRNGSIEWFPAPEYDGAKAIAYADKWTTNGTGGRDTKNPAYPTDNDDCTFFVSQVLREGGMGLVGTKNPLDHSHNDQWWYVPDTAGGFVQTYSWGGAQNLFDYLTHTNVDGHNLAAQTRTITSIDEKSQPFIPGGVVPGDVLFYKWKPSSPTMDHASVVVGEDTPWNLDTSRLPKSLDYSRTTVIDQHTDNRHRTFWSGNPSSGEWPTTQVFVVHPFQKADHPWSKTSDQPESGLIERIQE